MQRPLGIRGFSLVELSVVLVVIGLLVGGVVAAQVMLKASEMKAVATEFQKYRAAIGSFREKYYAIPGDMPNAVAFWGAQTGSTADGLDSACVALTYTTPSTTSATCNGDGNQLAGNTDATAHERWRFWQHLANAGLIAGK